MPAKAKKPKAGEMREGSQSPAFSPLQQRFVDIYPSCLNATEAYKKAGGQSDGHAAEQAAYRLMAMPHVKAAIDAALANLTKDAKVTANEVIQGIRRIASYDVRKLYDSKGKIKPPHEWDAETADAVAQVEFKNGRIVKIKMCDKLRAREILGKYLDLFRVEPPPEEANKGEKPEMISVDAAREIFRSAAELADRYHYQARPAQRPPAGPEAIG